MEQKKHQRRLEVTGNLNTKTTKQKKHTPSIIVTLGHALTVKLKSQIQEKKPLDSCSPQKFHTPIHRSLELLRLHRPKTMIPKAVQQPAAVSTKVFMRSLTTVKVSNLGDFENYYCSYIEYVSLTKGKHTCLRNIRKPY